MYLIHRKFSLQILFIYIVFFITLMIKSDINHASPTKKQIPSLSEVKLPDYLDAGYSDIPEYTELQLSNLTANEQKKVQEFNMKGKHDKTIALVKIKQNFNTPYTLSVKNFLGSMEVFSGNKCVVNPCLKRSWHDKNKSRCTMSLCTKEKEITLILYKKGRHSKITDQDIKIERPVEKDEDHEATAFETKISIPRTIGRGLKTTAKTILASYAFLSQIPGYSFQQIQFGSPDDFKEVMTCDGFPEYVDKRKAVETNPGFYQVGGEAFCQVISEIYKMSCCDDRIQSGVEGYSKDFDGNHVIQMDALSCSSFKKEFRVCNAALADIPMVITLSPLELIGIITGSYAFGIICVIGSTVVSYYIYKKCKDSRRPVIPQTEEAYTLATKGEPML
ncbi:hypothetical protein CI610_02540 [invertebrate metagenome]|uniref:Uncharacterized protein n=1 Tax=invertebrate metagenome TaxID=1711999 RepID=A0A2H9T5L6_9ZZZZ